MSQSTILELADRYAKEYFMGRGEEAKKPLQAAIMAADTAAYVELRKTLAELVVAKAVAFEREEAWQKQHWELADALAALVKDFKLLRRALQNINRGTVDIVVQRAAKDMLARTQPTHDIYKDGDENIPSTITDSNGSVTLGLCKTCGRAECELEEPCIPRKVMAHPNLSAPYGQSSGYRVFKDGSMWCVTGPGFIDLQQSVSAFGATPIAALSMFISMERQNGQAHSTGNLCKDPAPPR